MTTAAMTQRDAMESFDSMLVYADSLDEVGDEQSCLVRSAAWCFEYANRTMSLVKLHPTGSRFYGSYATPASDWDWFGLDESVALPEPHIMQTRGFKLGGSVVDESSRRQSMSIYVGGVNLILFAERTAFDAFAKATDECRAVNPPTREVTMDIFRKHGAAK